MIKRWLWECMQISAQALIGLLCWLILVIASSIFLIAVLACAVAILHS